MSSLRMSRREFLRLAGIASSAAALAACQPTAMEPEEPEPDEKPSEPTAAPPAAEPVTIEFLGSPGNDDLYPEEEAKFREENPNIEWILVSQAEGMSRLEQLLSLVAAGTPPDCARVESDVYRTFCKDKLLLPLTDFINADDEMSDPNYWIQPQEKERCEYEGQWYGIGSCWVAPHFYYNLDLFDELGIEPPSNDPDEAWQWDEFINVCRQLTEDDGGNHPGDAGFDPESVVRWGVSWPTWWIPLHAAVQCNGADWVDAVSQEIVLDTPDAMEAIQTIADLALVDNVMPTSTAMEALGMGSAQLLETKMLGLQVDGSWALSWLWEIEGTLGTGSLPAMKEPGTDMQAHLVTVVKDTEHPEESWKLIRFLSSPWYQERYCRTGLWLPSQSALMTDEAIARWCVEPEHPAGYEKIVREFTPRFGHYLTMPVGYRKAADLALQPAFDAIFVGDAAAADVLPDAVSEANRLMAEEQARG